MFRLLSLAVLGFVPSALGLALPAVGAPQVTTSLGTMVGSVHLSRDGNQYFAFNGIPYAQPPVGKLRLMPPQPAKPWEGVLNATVPGPLCYQKPFLLYEKEMQGQEDCLYVNVYTPKLEASYPVMVYVHGGAFTQGWPGSQMKPSYFMDEQVVIVTLSYRLGYLGFLSFEDDVIPGNYGIKDQVLALEWVKKEIKNFGGNPDLITAFGISAGAASSHYLCSIAKSRDLLKGCISQSGIGGTIWALHAPGDGKAMATKLAKELHCKQSSTSEILSCLQSLPLESFIPTVDIEHITDFPGPVLEKQSDTAAITQWPTGFSDFPWIAGFVANEGLLITEYLKDFGTVIEKIGFILDGNNLLVKALHLKGRSIIEDIFKITTRFFKLKDMLHIFTDYEKFFTEAFWKYPLFKEMTRHTGPKYVYRFAYAGGPSLWEQISNKSLNVGGICHGDDGSYFFNLSNYYQPSGWPGPEDVQLSRTLVKMWVNFATHQVPMAEGVQWEQFDDYGSYLDITNDGLIKKNYTDFQEIIDFWNDIKLPPY